MFLIVPHAADSVGVVTAILSHAGATDLTVRWWHAGRLAYRIDDHETGVYILARFEATAAAVRNATRAANLSDLVPRALILRSAERADARVASKPKRRARPPLRAVACAANERER